MPACPGATAIIGAAAGTPNPVAKAGTLARVPRRETGPGVRGSVMESVLARRGSTFSP